MFENYINPQNVTPDARLVMVKWGINAHPASISRLGNWWGANVYAWLDIYYNPVSRYDQVIL